MSVTERSKTSRASSRTDPTRAKRRQREIIDAAAEIFHRKGYSETSMQEIAEAVGILKGSLYYYIDSKEDLLFQMLLEVHEHAKGIVEETAALEVSAVERLRAYVQRHVEYNAQNLSKIAVYYHDFGLLTAKRKRAIMDQRRYYEQFVIGLIEDAKADGSVDALGRRVAGGERDLWRRQLDLHLVPAIGQRLASVPRQAVRGAHRQRDLKWRHPGGAEVQDQRSVVGTSRQGQGERSEAGLQLTLASERGTPNSKPA